MLKLFLWVFRNWLPSLKSICKIQSVDIIYLKNRVILFTVIHFFLLGETHYHAYEKPLVYFQVLTLTGQFEPAIEFLSRIPRYQVHAVHMALALHDVYMLGTPRNVQAPLRKFFDIYSTRNVRILVVSREWSVMTLGFLLYAD